MKPETDIAIVCLCLYGLILPGALALVFWGLYLLTEGVEGLGRRLYAMLLLLLSVLGVGIVLGVPICLCTVAVYWGLAAAGIPLGAFTIGLAALSRRPDDGEPRIPWLTAYLEWIKRVAQGKKAQLDGEKDFLKRFAKRQVD